MMIAMPFSAIDFASVACDRLVELMRELNVLDIKSIAPKVRTSPAPITIGSANPFLIRVFFGLGYCFAGLVMTESIWLKQLRLL